MAAMTNQAAPGNGESIDASIQALASVGGSRRPVKVVEHPAFRRHPSHAGRQAALRASFIVLPVRVVSLNTLVPRADGHAAAA